MIVTSQHQVTNQHGVQSEGSFAISLRNQAHLMTILRDTLYSDKILAVLREYAANAWDAHRQSGCGDVPIRVTLPTRAEPTLVIRDFGSGLSEEDLYQVYTQYGESTKRESNETVGYLGIGSKSAFSYSDSFLITSYHAGVKSVYCAVLDSSNIGEVKRLSQSNTHETGLEIRVPVRQQDMDAFQARAQRLFRWFVPQPVINTPLEPEKYRFDTPYGGISPNSGSWIAVMGCVPYALKLSQIQSQLVDANLFHVFQNTSGYLRFDLGAVQVNASREELKYGDQTIAEIVRVAHKLIESCWEQVQAQSDKEATPWGKLLVQHSARFLTGYARMSSFQVDLEDIPFTVRNKSAGPSEGKTLVLPVHENTRVVIRDTKVPLKLFNLKAQETVLGGDTKRGLPLLMKALSEYGGLPVVLTSSLVHSPKPTKVAQNPAIRGKVFLLRDTVDQYPASSNWKQALDVSPDDVWFRIDRFVPCVTRLTQATFQDVDLSWRSIKRDRAIAEALGLPVPRILGYRDVPQNPVGIPYAQWHAQLWDRVANTPEIMAKVLATAYRDHWGTFNLYDVIAKVETVCPDPQDPLRVLLSQYSAYTKPPPRSDALMVLKSTHPLSPVSLWTNAVSKYPLLKVLSGSLTQVGTVEGFSDYLSLVYQKNLNPVIGS